MLARPSPPAQYSPGELALLKIVLEESYTEWRLSRLAPTQPGGELEVKLRLARVILQYAATGERDPEYLMDIARDGLR